MNTYDVDKYENGQPLLIYEEDDHCLTGQNLQMPFVRWGDVQFGLIPNEPFDTIDIWVHEFTEDAIGDILQGEEGIDLCTIAQIIGHASGIDIIYNNYEYFGILHHVLTSLVCESKMPSADGGFLSLSGDEFWDVLMTTKKKKLEEI